MNEKWSFGRKVGTGFAIVVVLAILISVIAVYALNHVIASKDLLIERNAKVVIEASRLDGLVETKVSAGRAFLLSRDEDFLKRVNEARSQYRVALERLKTMVQTDEELRFLDQIERAEADHQQGMEQAVLLRNTDATLDAIAKAFNSQMAPKRDVLDQKINDFISYEKDLLAEGKRTSTEAAQSAILMVIGMVVVAVLLAVFVAVFLTSTLSRQIGEAVHHVQSSSAELQSAANQQASGSKEAAMAMSEITTTISELLATSRQIAESAQRVTHIAEETATSARAGDQTAQRTHESVISMKRQIDVIVTHMLELGKKSQQIGGVLEIINELAEQTNILAINATIEAAGAGDAGKRFAIVADEIRKLADRVGGSTKEIRLLIDEVRSAVNSTIMATESGSKVVDAGAQQFLDVASALKQITGMVGTTSEAAREIELSTKQQTSAVEQVNLAMSNVSQVTRETEASSSQTLETATQLNSLSRQLMRLIQPNMSA